MTRQCSTDGSTCARDRWKYVREMTIAAHERPVIKVVDNSVLRIEETNMVGRAALVPGRNHTFMVAGYRTFVSTIRATVSIQFPAMAKPVNMLMTGGPGAQPASDDEVTSLGHRRAHSSPRSSPERERTNYRRGGRGDRVRGHRGRGQRRRDHSEQRRGRDNSRGHGCEE